VNFARCSTHDPVFASFALASRGNLTGRKIGSLEVAMTFVFRQVYKRSQMIIFYVRGVLAGNFNTTGAFNNLGSNANFWSSLQSGSTAAWNRELNSGNTTVNRNTNNQTNGFSVRCLKNWLPSIQDYG
jgi:hypothetical protein